MEFTHNMGKEDYKKIENLNKKLEKNPNNLELLMEKALIYDECYYDKEVIKTYNKIIELYPNYINAYFLLSFYTTQFACNPEEGIKIAKEGLKINSKSGELHYTLASAIEILNGYNKNVLNHLKKSIELLPNWISPRIALIEYYIDNKNYSEAKKEIQNTIKILKKYPEEKPKDPIKQKISFIARTDRYQDVRKSLKNFSNKIDELERATN